MKELMRDAAFVVVVFAALVWFGIGAASDCLGLDGWILAGLVECRGNGGRHGFLCYWVRLKGSYVVARIFFLLLLNCSAWPCLGPA